MTITYLNFLPNQGFNDTIYYLNPEGKFYGWDFQNNRFYNLSTPSIDDLSGLNFDNLQDGDVLSYDSATQTWINKVIDVSGGVSSFNERTGDVTLLDTDVTTALGYTPEDVANKTFEIIPELINDTQYPTTSAVYNFVINLGYITSSSLTGYATETWVNSRGFITNVATALGYTPENTANKSTTITGNETSNTLFPTIKSVVDWVTSLFIRRGTNTTNYVQKVTGTGTIGDSQIFDNGTNIGIGNTNPQSRVHITNQGSLVSDIGFKVRNFADTGDMFNVKGNGNVQVGIGGVSICRTDSPNGSLLGTITYRTDGTLGFSNGLTASRLSNPSSASSYIESTFYNGTWQVFGQGSGTNSVFLIKTSSASTNSFFLKLQNGTTDLLNLTINGNLLLGTSTDSPSSILTLASTTKGFLPPRMTNAQRLAISSPAVGLIIYQTDGTEGLYINKSTGWTFII